MPDKINLFPRAAYIAKALTVLVLTLTGAIVQGLIVGAPAAWIAVVIAALSGAGVYVAPNGPKPEVSPTDS